MSTFNVPKGTQKTEEQLLKELQAGDIDLKEKAPAEIPQEILNAMKKANIPVDKTLNSFTIADGDELKKASSLAGKDLSLADIQAFSDGKKVEEQISPQEEPSISDEPADTTESEEDKSLRREVEAEMERELEIEAEMLKKAFDAVIITEEEEDTYFDDMMSGKNYTETVFSNNKKFEIIFREKTAEDLMLIRNRIREGTYHSDMDVNTMASIINVAYGTVRLKYTKDVKTYSIEAFYMDKQGRYPFAAKEDSQADKGKDIFGHCPGPFNQPAMMETVIQRILLWTDAKLRIINTLMVKFDIKTQKLAKQVQDKNFS